MRHGSSNGSQHLQLDAFASLSHDALKDAKVQENMIALQNLWRNHNPKTNYSWEHYQELMEEFLQAFDDFEENDCLRSKSFHLWNTLQQMVSIVF